MSDNKIIMELDGWDQLAKSGDLSILYKLFEARAEALQNSVNVRLEGGDKDGAIKSHAKMVEVLGFKKAIKARRDKLMEE